MLHGPLNVKYISYWHGFRERVSAMVKNFFRAPQRRRTPAENIYTKSERMTLSCRVTLAWYERANLYSRHVILPTNMKTYTIYWAQAPPSRQPAAGNVYRPPPPLQRVVGICYWSTLITTM
jgi:hypothetical protein